MPLSVRCGRKFISRCFSSSRLFGLVLLLSLSAGCASRSPVTITDPAARALYLPTAEITAASQLFARFAPAFRVLAATVEHNRIGSPAWRPSADAAGEIFVNPKQPAIYCEKATFNGSLGSYTNLIYRVHFPRVPFGLAPFNITYGKQPGLLAVVTLNAADKAVLLSLVHTCGCYLAFIPTTALPPSALPTGWPVGASGQEVHGEFLPVQLDLSDSAGRLLLTLRPDTHRIMAVEVAAEGDFTGSADATIAMPLRPIAVLDELPAAAGKTSFFYDDGWLKDYVKGAVKPWESLLMSWFSLDLQVGMDKRLSHDPKSCNPFYTSLKPWRRRASDMNDFRRFLAYWGWGL